jgi:chemotaxis protein MotB
LVRKRKPPDNFNSDRWLVSYADFITLLFAFFTTMYAISTVDAQKMGRLVLSMRASFDSAMFPPGSDTLSLSGGQGAAPIMGNDVLENVGTPKEKASRDYSVTTLKDLKSNFAAVSGAKGEIVALGKIRSDVESLVQARKMGGKVNTRMEGRGLVISLGEGGFFDSGSDQLKPEGRALLDSLAESLLAASNQVRVEGHTDTVPIRTARFPSNWELSTARATTIVSYLVSRFGFSPEKLSAAGYGEFRPIASNDTDEGRARNRRVDVVVLNSTVAKSEPK